MRYPKAYAAIAVAVIGVSFASIFIRWSGSHALVKATYRMAFSSLLLLPLAIRYRSSGAYRVSFRDILMMTAVGIALALHFATWISSLDYTNVASSVILVNTHTLLVALASHYFLKERVSLPATIGIAIGFGGLGLIVYGDLGGGTDLVGDALAFTGGLMAAAYILAGRRIRQRVPLVPYVFVVYTVSALALLIMTLSIGVSLSPSGDVAREIVLFLGLAVVSTLLGHTLYNWSLKHVSAPVVSTSLLGEPIGATLLAIALLGEYPGSLDIAGGALVLLGIYLTARGMHAREAEPSG